MDCFPPTPFVGDLEKSCFFIFELSHRIALNYCAAHVLQRMRLLKIVPSRALKCSTLNRGSKPDSVDWLSWSRCPCIKAWGCGPNRSNSPEIAIRLAVQQSARFRGPTRLHQPTTKPLSPNCSLGAGTGTAQPLPAEKVTRPEQPAGVPR